VVCWALLQEAAKASLENRARVTFWAVIRIEGEGWGQS
jgi:hypothetical protein